MGCPPELHLSADIFVHIDIYSKMCIIHIGQKIFLLSKSRYL